MSIMQTTLKSYFFFTLSAFGISLSVIANIGVSSYNSMNLAIANMAHVKIGTITIILNFTFLLLYMVLTRFEYKIKYVVQAISLIMFGTLINFFTYTILGNISSLLYFQRILLITAGTLVGGLSIGMIIHYNIITFPLESLCLKISERGKLTFVQLRYMVDIFSAIVSVSISLTSHLPLYVREGTLISMLVLSASMNASKSYFSKKSVLSSQTR